MCLWGADPIPGSEGETLMCLSQFSIEGDFALLGLPAMFEDIFGCHNWGMGASG